MNALKTLCLGMLLLVAALPGRAQIEVTLSYPNLDIFYIGDLDPLFTHREVEMSPDETGSRGGLGKNQLTHLRWRVRIGHVDDAHRPRVSLPHICVVFDGGHPLGDAG